MDEIFLDAQVREGTGRSKVKDVRDSGFVPGVIYSGGKDSKAIQVSHHDLVRLLHQHRLENAVINLKIKDDSKQKARSCLIKEIQYNPVSDEIMHVDFNEISLTQVIKINVPVVAKGDPVGVKQEGGSLEHILWEIEVECLPTDIPKEIEVDVTNLKIGDAIHLKDVTLPPKIKALHDPETILLSVAAPIKEEVAATPAEGEEKQEPEVIKEKKEVPGAGEEAPEAKEKK